MEDNYKDIIKFIESLNEDVKNAWEDRFVVRVLGNRGCIVHVQLKDSKLKCAEDTYVYWSAQNKGLHLYNTFNDFIKRQSVEG